MNWSGVMPAMTTPFDSDLKVDHEFLAQHAAWPFYTGDGDRDLTDEERKNVTDHIAKFSAIGQGIRAKYPKAQRILQWGNPLGTLAYMRGGMPKELVDGFKQCLLAAPNLGLRDEDVLALHPN